MGKDYIPLSLNNFNIYPVFDKIINREWIEYSLKLNNLNKSKHYNKLKKNLIEIEAGTNNTTTTILRFNNNNFIVVPATFKELEDIIK